MKATKKLEKKEIEKKLLKMSGWRVNQKHTELSKSFPVSSFMNALSLTARIAVISEVMNHHPEVTLSYTDVSIKLSTHDVSGLTVKDFELATKLDLIKTN